MAEPSTSSSPTSSQMADNASQTATDAQPVRYRCTACGNLTRFDVTTSRRTKAFHHYTVGGELEVEDTQVLDEVIEEVSCRWCSSSAAVETVE